MSDFKLLILSAFSFLVFCVGASNTYAQDNQVKYDASSDYIQDCKYATCVGLAAMRWSKKHPFGVAVGVRMGTKPAVTDDQIKMVLKKDLKYYGVTEVKFFYEKHLAVASAISLHVRGGTEGPFVISNVRQEIKGVSERAKNTNPATVITR